MTTPDAGDVKPEISEAIREIADRFPDATLNVDADGDGGAYVVVENVPLSPLYKQRETWVGFRISYMYPDADVYPHFVRDDLERTDGRPLGTAAAQGYEFQGRAAIQLSRRSNRRNPTTDTAVLKLQKVLKWLNDLP